MRRTLVNVVTRGKRRFWAERGLFPRIAGASAIAGPDDAIAGRVDLLRALGHLPMEQRAVIVLRYFEDLSEDDIAKTLHVSNGTVKSRASRAMASLRELLEGEDDNA
jgi:DNA-directed RNA polymerase specialized sigma24 family protein